MRESKIEARYRKAIKLAGGEFYKWTSPGRRNVPDRIMLLPVKPEHREVLKKYVIFIEMKATGKKATKAQLREHERLRNLGYEVRVINEIRTETISTDR